MISPLFSLPPHHPLSFFMNIFQPDWPRCFPWPHFSIFALANKSAWNIFSQIPISFTSSYPFLLNDTFHEHPFKNGNQLSTTALLISYIMLVVTLCFLLHKTPCLQWTYYIHCLWPPLFHYALYKQRSCFCLFLFFTKISQVPKKYLA